MSNRTLELLIIFLIAPYLVGLYTPLQIFAGLGQFIHLILVAIVIVVVVRLLQGMKAR